MPRVAYSHIYTYLYKSKSLLQGFAFLFYFGYICIKLIIKSMKRSILLLSLFTLFCSTCSNSPEGTQQPSNSSATPTLGKTLPAWSDGELDIHFINTARGECCFYILPDGTTLLVDAGEIASSDENIPQRPNDLTRPYVTYANYISHFMPAQKSAIDYCSPSHFHIDHIGGEDVVTESAAAGYRKAGLLALYDRVPYNHILDRAYPTYTEDDKTPAIEGQLAEDWATFVKWGVSEGRFTAERFTPGKEQIVLLNNAAKYENFSVFNICANGFVWGKDSEGNETLLGSKPKGSGNPCSCGFHITYGKFDYIACGDLTSSPQNLMALYFRDFIGNGNLEAFKCHHHLASNSWGSNMLNTNFDPQVAVGHCFASTKPHPEKLAEILPKVRDFFATNIYHQTLNDNKELIDKIGGYDGHIVLRVAPGGESFMVYILNDTNFNFYIKSIHGPYKSK